MNKFITRFKSDKKFRFTLLSLLAAAGIIICGTQKSYSTIYDFGIVMCFFGGFFFGRLISTLINK